MRHPRRLPRTAALFALALLATLAGGPARSADAPPTGQGKFRSKDVSFDVGSACAFRGKGFFDTKEDVLIVAITNAQIRPEQLGLYYDRKRAFEYRVQDEETAVVYFEFTPKGEYRGLSYHFAPGNGCGYCSGGVESSVKLSGGRLVGSLKGGKEKDRSFDVTLDVPVQSDEHGAALPSGGGDPGKAYLAYHDALVKRDAAALKPVLSERRLETYARAEKENDLDGYIAFLRKEHPVKSVRITKGFGTEGNAVLLIEGETDLMKVAGEVVLLNEKGSWRVKDEVVEPTLD